jgi:hypothetical protein
VPLHQWQDFTSLNRCLKKTDVIAKKLDRLITEPFITGTRMANEAISLPFSNRDEQVFREKRFDSAIDKLEEARTIVDPRFQTTR